MTPLRKTALKRIVYGIVGCICFGVLWLIVEHFGFLPAGPFSLIGSSFPFVCLCVGIIELITNSPYKDTACRWDALRGWQRGVLGTFIVLASLVVFGILATAVGMFLSR